VIDDNTQTSSIEAESRRQLLKTLKGIDAWDELERSHLATATQWVESGAPLWRVRKPDVPPIHLVSYFVVLNEKALNEEVPSEDAPEILLVAHRKAGLWLPTGGHVEPGEHPWEAARRECREELDIQARPSRASASGASGEKPLFITVSQTRGEGTHTDVSLWYVLDARREDITFYDQEEFEEIAWVSFDEISRRPPNTMDPHMRRFVDKLKATLKHLNQMA
jgi:8-oxo-dGTP pyrophosphatase MutT (NUDIX family)